jgi:hypothetical protein
VGAVALLLIVAAVPGARADGHPAYRTVAIDTHYDDQGSVILPHTCSVSIPGLCEFTFSSKPRWTGTFTGTSINHAYGSFNPLTQSVEGEIWEYFPEVAVAGCGAGTMMWHAVFEMTPGEQDPTTGGVVGHGTWSYVRGSGTGGLAAIRSGLFTAEHVSFQLPFMENHDKAVGSMVCRPRRSG